MRLYRCPYYDTMKPWERKLSDWGLLGYLVQDVIGANQEESFGIRQNHSMYLNDWNALVKRHFAAHEYEIFVPERGWGERVVKRFAVKLDPYGSTWRAARLLGGTLAAVCRKAGDPLIPRVDMTEFHAYLRCPDCTSSLDRDSRDRLRCSSCAYEAANEGGVYNLLRSKDRTELYPGDRADVIDFCLPEHAARLGEGWFELEGIFGNKYRWIGRRATLTLRRMRPGPQRIRIRGHANEESFQQGKPVTIEVHANGEQVGRWQLDRLGLFVLEADMPNAEDYNVEINSSPEWKPENDSRMLSVNLSMVRLVPREP
jgi:hypothetical protein